MTTLKAHFNGKVLVPDEPVNLPMNCALKVQVEPMPSESAKDHVSPVKPSATLSTEEKPLMKLLRLLEELPDNPDAPTDGAAQHDHYLYGLPKRP
jgi:hypothetical protein